MRQLVFFLAIISLVYSVTGCNVSESEEGILFEDLEMQEELILKLNELDIAHRVDADRKIWVKPGMLETVKEIAFGLNKKPNKGRLIHQFVLDDYTTEMHRLLQENRIEHEYYLDQGKPYLVLFYQNQNEWEPILRDLENKIADAIRGQSN